MSPQVLYRVLFNFTKPTKAKQNQLTIVPAILHSYCRHKVYMCDYPGIISQEGKSVLGVYVTGLDDQNIWRLDIFEGSQYRREKVKVKLLQEVHGTKIGRVEGQEVDAQTYVFLDKNDLMDEEWSYDEFVKEKIHRWVDTSEEYDGKFCLARKVLLGGKITLIEVPVEVDNAVELGGHDPTGGRGINGEMENKLSSKEQEEALESAV